MDRLADARAGAAASSGCSTVFFIAFIASTLVPLGSEPAVFGLVKLNPEMFWPAICVATAGATLGGARDLVDGLRRRARLRAHDAQAPPTAAPALAASASAPKACLLSWLPVVGDPLCAVAGWLQAAVLAVRRLHGDRQVRPLLRHDRRRCSGSSPVSTRADPDRKEDAVASSIRSRGRNQAALLRGALLDGLGGLAGRGLRAWRRSSSPRRLGALGDLAASASMRAISASTSLADGTPSFFSALAVRSSKIALELVPLLAGLGGDVAGHAGHPAGDFAEASLRRRSASSSAATCLP